MTEDLIRKFFNRTCTPGEADDVRQYLKARPEILSQFLSREEWDSTRPIEMKDEYWNEVWNEMEDARKHRSIRWLPTAAVAASIVIVVTIAFNFFTVNNKKESVTTIARHDPLPERQTIKTNSSQQIISLTLPDGSPVELSPGSSITYNDPFDVDRRDIQLDGKARFNVQKDRSKPFTVFAGGLATTAVGTAFTINTHANNHNGVNVLLHEGKVMIKQTGPSHKKWKEDIYLTAGQQLVYHPGEAVAAVSKIGEKITKRKSNPGMPGKPAGTAGTEKLSFDGSPLHDVMLQVEKFYGITVIFPENDLHGKTFTGSVSKNDSPAMVLKVIAQMNDLEITETDGQYQIKKIN